MDFLSLEMFAGGYENILVITDRFTWFAQAIPSKYQTAMTTARLLFDNFVNMAFPPAYIVAKVLTLRAKSLPVIANVHKSRTTPYHAMGNGIPERLNKTLLNNTW